MTHQKRFNNNVLFKLDDKFKNEHCTFSTPKSNTNETNLILTTIDYVNNFHNDANDDDDSVTNNNTLFVSCSKKVKQSSCQHIINAQNNDASSTYLYSTSAIKNVIGTAFSNNKWCPVDITTEEMEFHLSLTDLCCNMTERKQQQFSNLLNQLVSINFNTTRPPTSFHDLQKLYLSGKHFIYKNMPVPKVIELDNHAYVSVTEIIQFSLSTIENISLIQASNHVLTACDNITMTSCQKARDIIRHINKQFCDTDIDPYVLFITL